LALVADARCTSQSNKRVKQPRYPAICRIKIILRNMFPNAVQIQVGIDAEDIPAHAPVFPALRRFMLYPCLRLAWINVLATIKAVQPKAQFPIKFRKLNGPELVALFQKAKGFPHNFAR
jgi:hypothetical protein